MTDQKICDKCSKNDDSGEVRICPYVEVVCLDEMECNCCDDCHNECLTHI